MKPLMDEVVERTGETVQLATLEGVSAVYLALSESPHPMKLTSRAGARLPAYTSAIGKALLAELDPPRRRGGSTAPSSTSSPTTRSSRSRRCSTELERTRERGYASTTRSSRSVCAASRCRSATSTARWSRRSRSRCRPRATAARPPRTRARRSPRRRRRRPRCSGAGRDEVERRDDRGRGRPADPPDRLGHGHAAALAMAGPRRRWGAALGYRDRGDDARGGRAGARRARGGAGGAAPRWSSRTPTSTTTAATRSCASCFRDARLRAHELDRPLIESWERIAAERYGWYRAHGLDYPPDDLGVATRGGRPRHRARRRRSTRASGSSSAGSRSRSCTCPGTRSATSGCSNPTSRTALIADAAMGWGFNRHDGGRAGPPPYVDLAAYRETIEAIRGLGAERLGTAHFPTMEGESIGEFLDLSRRLTDEVEAGDRGGGRRSTAIRWRRCWGRSPSGSAAIPRWRSSSPAASAPTSRREREAGARVSRAGRGAVRAGGGGRRAGSSRRPMRAGSTSCRGSPRAASTPAGSTSASAGGRPAAAGACGRWSTTSTSTATAAAAPSTAARTAAGCGPCTRAAATRSATSTPAGSRTTGPTGSGSSAGIASTASRCSAGRSRSASRRSAGPTSAARSSGASCCG